MAQITIPPAVRGGSGQSDVTSPSVTIPSGMTSIGITYSIPQADRNNASASIWQRIEISTDGGTTWQLSMDGGVWTGGSGTVSRSGVLNPPPSMQIAGPSLAALVGKLTRGRWEIPVAMTIGATVTAV